MNALPSPKAGILSIHAYAPGKSAQDAAIREIKLSSNENPYGPNPKAAEAYREAASTLERYPDGGATALREAITAMHGPDASHIVCGAGSDELIGLLIRAYAGPGDEVLYSEHGFLMYKIYTQSCGATPVTARESNLTAHVDHLLAEVTERTRLVFLANPNNPTGTWLNNDEITRLRSNLPGHVILCIDGAYAEYITDTDYCSGQELAMSTPNTVMCRTFSKIHGLASLRLGWMAGPAEIIDVMHRVRSPFNVSSAAQAAGMAAITDTDYITHQRDLNNQQRAWLAQELEKLSLNPVPGAGNFLLAHAGNEPEATRLINALATQHIYIRNVSSYGLGDYMRITVGTAEENQQLMHVLGKLR